MLTPPMPPPKKSYRLRNWLTGIGLVITCSSAVLLGTRRRHSDLQPAADVRRGRQRPAAPIYPNGDGSPNRPARPGWALNTTKEVHYVHSTERPAC